MVCPNQRAESVQCNSYAIDIDRRNRNCYSCGEFGHLARNCKNREIENRIGKGRKLEYGQDNGQNNLNGERNLIVFN